MTGIPEAVVRFWVGHVDRDILKIQTHIANADSQSGMKRLAEVNQVSSNSKDKKSHDESNEMVS